MINSPQIGQKLHSKVFFYCIFMVYHWRPTYRIFINWPQCQHPWWQKLEKEAMAASSGEAWSKKLTISAKFKLSNVTSDQLMDCCVSIVMHYDIAIQ